MTISQENPSLLHYLIHSIMFNELEYIKRNVKNYVLRSSEQILDELIQQRLVNIGTYNIIAIKNELLLYRLDGSVDLIPYRTEMFLFVLPIISTHYFLSASVYINMINSTWSLIERRHNDVSSLNYRGIQMTETIKNQAAQLKKCEQLEAKYRNEIAKLQLEISNLKKRQEEEIIRLKESFEIKPGIVQNKPELKEWMKKVDLQIKTAKEANKLDELLQIYARYLNAQLNPF